MKSDKAERKIVGWIFPMLLGLTVLAAFVVRLLINFGTELIPGTNGAYYLIQARSVAQNGSLAFTDSPLAFYLQGYFSLFVNLFVGNLDKSVMFSVKFLDSLLPALCAFPMFLIAKTWIKDRRTLLLSFVIIVYCAFHFYGFLLAGDLQKNPLGLLFLLFYIYFLLLAFSNQKARNFVLAGFFLALCGLTHIAVFGVAVSIIIASLPLWFFVSGKFSNNKTRIASIIGIVVAIFVFTVITFLFQNKSNSLFSILSYPVKLFRNPYIFTMISSASTPMGSIPLPEIINMLFNHTVIAFAIWNLVKIWKTADNATKTLVITLTLACLLLSSPLVGKTYAARFYILSYIPSSVLLVFLLGNIEWQWKKVVLVLTSTFILFSFVSTARLETRPSISTDVYQDLIAFKSQMQGTKKSIAVAKHGLEWWAGWTLGTAVTKEYYVTEETFKRFANVYYLVENIAPNPQGTQTGQVFPDVAVPEESQMVFEGKNLSIHKASAPPQIDATNAPPVAIGMIVEASDSSLAIITPEGQKTILLDEETKLEEGLYLQRGVAVKIWGDEQFMSPSINATLIIEDKNPQRPPEPPIRR